MTLLKTAVVLVGGFPFRVTSSAEGGPPPSLLELVIGVLTVTAIACLGKGCV